jgi:hypothetical protein
MKSKHAQQKKLRTHTIFYTLLAFLQPDVPSVLRYMYISKSANFAFQEDAPITYALRETSAEIFC